MSNMGVIIEKLQGDKRSIDAKKRWIDTKTGWNNYTHSKEKEDLEKKISPLVKINKTREERGRTINLKKNTEISIVKNSNLPEFKSFEESLERIITFLNLKIFNQLCIGSNNKESIDLIYSNNEHNEEDNKYLIELKTTANTPLYAFIELIKDYCLLKKLDKSDRGKIEKLILLAPKSYFEKFKEQNSIIEFFKTIEEFNKNSESKFSIMYFDGVNEETFEPLISYINNTNTRKIQWESSNSVRYNYVKHIELSEISEKDFNLKNLPKNLLFENWEELNIEKWMKL